MISKFVENPYDHELYSNINIVVCKENRFDIFLNYNTYFLAFHTIKFILCGGKFGGKILFMQVL